MIYATLGVLALLFLANQSQGETIMTTANLSPDDRWDSLFKKYGTQYGIPWRWLKAIAMNESSLGQAKSVKRGLENPSDVAGSVSSDGKSWGLMQLTLPTARQFESTVTEIALNDPEVSIRIAAKYIAWIIKNYWPITNREAVIRSYNGGPGFNKTVAGIRDTPAYYSRFKDNLGVVLARQPGNELALS